MKIKAIVGLGNPGPSYVYTRHNIGFRVVDELAQRYGASWHTKSTYAIAEILQPDGRILLIKPLTGMNVSGVVVPVLKAKGILISELLVVHDELELPFGKIAVKQGGSAKGHNGLRSLIAAWGIDFWRMRCGIGRPAQKEQVPEYVLSRFDESNDSVRTLLVQAADQIEEFLSQDL